MKWFSILVLGTVAFLVNACEKHPASNLPPEHATAFGSHGWKPGDAAHGHGDDHGHAPATGGHGAAAAPAHAPAATPAPATAPADAPAGEAPKFFPEKK